MRTLDDRDVSLLELALRIARDRFKEDAEVARNARQPGLEGQFLHQVEHAETLLALLEGMPVVTLRAD